MLSISDLIKSHRTYETYGDILENKASFGLTREEEELYNQEKNNMMQRLRGANSSMVNESKVRQNRCSGISFLGNLSQIC